MYRDTESEFLSTSEASRLCGVARTTISKWIDEGLLKAFVTPGGHRKIKRQDLKSFIEERGLVPKAGIFGKRAKKKILVVDDNPDDIRLVQAAFLAAQDRYEVHTARGGFEAIYKIGDIKPDLVVLDIVMPDMDGFSVCKNIKNNPITKGVKVVAVTAYPDEETRDKAFSCGVDAFFPKPLDLGALIKKILGLLGQK